MANMNDNVDAQADTKLVDTEYGPVYSKRRMMIVIYKHIEDMTCLPLYSFGYRGILCKPVNLGPEHVGVIDRDDQTYKNESVYQAFVATCRRKPLHPATACRLTGGTNVNCKEDIAQIGIINQQSYNRLEALYADRMKIAAAEPYKVFANKQGGR